MDKKHPYSGRPPHQFWANEQAIQSGKGFDPVTRVSFKISAEEAIVSAGSCFAQHLTRVLQRSGFNYLITETPHPIVSPAIADKFNYGAFSARYGNIYTARQLRQLIERAYGVFAPLDEAWQGQEGGLVDPFRPLIHPGGFVSSIELRQDRTTHFEAVRSTFESLSCFVFTLGLTEAWLDRRDGAVFPLAPGVAGGQFDPATYAFKNFSVDEIVEDLQWSIDFIRSKNPEAKFLFTVSPVPLNATYVDRHVFVSTTYSKSVLRVAAEQVTENNESCDYFPSYEIVTNPYQRKRFFNADCREVAPQGVAHVMKLFLKHYGDVQKSASQIIDLLGGLDAAADVGAGKEKGVASNRNNRSRGMENNQGRKMGMKQNDASDDKVTRRAKDRKFLETAQAVNRILCDEEMINND